MQQYDANRHHSTPSGPETQDLASKVVDMMNSQNNVMKQQNDITEAMLKLANEGRRNQWVANADQEDGDGGSRAPDSSEGRRNPWVANAEWEYGNGSSWAPESSEGRRNEWVANAEWEYGNDGSWAPESSGGRRTQWFANAEWEDGDGGSRAPEPRRSRTPLRRSARYLAHQRLPQQSQQRDVHLRPRSPQRQYNDIHLRPRSADDSGRGHRRRLKRQRDRAQSKAMSSPGPARFPSPSDESSATNE